MSHSLIHLLNDAALVFPTAFEIVTKDNKKYLFQHCLFRDECVDTILKIAVGSATTTATTRRKSSNVKEEKEKKEHSDRKEKELPPSMCSKDHSFTQVLETEISIGVENVFEKLWSDETTCYNSFLKRVGVENVQVEPWKNISVEENKNWRLCLENSVCHHQDSSSWDFIRDATDCICPDEDFHFGIESFRGRRVRFENQVKQVGKTVRTKLQQAQYMYSMGKNRLVWSCQAKISGLPMGLSNTFLVCTRIVFSRISERRTKVQIGCSLTFLKTSWFKSQIISSTKSEVRDQYRHWIAAAASSLDGCSVVKDKDTVIENSSKVDDGVLPSSAGRVNQQITFPSVQTMILMMLALIFLQYQYILYRLSYIEGMIYEITSETAVVCGGGGGVHS